MIGFEIEIVRSRRKTLSITVRDGKVVARAPLHMSQERIYAFAESKEDWIRRTLAGQNDPRFAPVKEGKAILVDGKLVPASFGAAKTRCGRACTAVKISALYANFCCPSADIFWKKSCSRSRGRRV